MDNRTTDGRFIYCNLKYKDRIKCDFYEKDIYYNRCKYHRNDGFYPMDFCTSQIINK